jgi:hypothetical protein
MININDQVSVHRSLLWDVSKPTQSLVKEAEEEHRRPASTKLLKGSARPPTYLHLFDDHNMGECELGLKLYSDFSYGQSMGFPSSEWSKGSSSREVVRHFDALLSVHQIALWYDHEDAADAALDAIRDLLSHGGDLYCSEDTLKTTLPDSPLNRVLMGFAVYSGQGKHWVALIDARTHPIPGFEDNFILGCFEKDRKKQPLDELLRITNELCRMFVRKDVDASAGLPPPDLMERCRYHSHGQNPCYLDK